MRFALVAARSTPTNVELTGALVDGGWEEMTPRRALEQLVPGDVVVGRLDVLPTLDGIDDGLWALGVLAARGVLVLNGPSTLLAAHDKLLTARLLRRHGIPHPWTIHVRPGRPPAEIAVPVVLKPRFGSWGRDVRRCEGRVELDAALAHACDQPWFALHGGLVQQLVPPAGYDLRIVVAGGRAAGAVNRIAPEGEWRTNVALGAVRKPVVDPPPEAVALAVEAARVVGASLVGVDLLPDGRGGWIVLELNGAVEFTAEYGPETNVFAEVALALQREAHDRGVPSTPLVAPV